MRLLQHFIANRKPICVTGGDLRPNEHAYLVAVVHATDEVQQFEHLVAAAAVDGIEAVVPVFSQFQCGNGGHLHGLEHTGVHVGFKPQHIAEDGGISYQHAYAPSGHVAGFAEAVQFQCHVHRAGGSHEAGGRFVQDEAVRVVVAQQDIMFGGEGHEFFESIGLGL